MKTRIALLLYCLLSAFLLQAQLSATPYKSKEYDQFKASKTYVVLTGDQKYDAEMQAVMDEVWKITPFTFINSTEFETKISDKSASFLTFYDIYSSNGEEVHYLALFNGGGKIKSSQLYIAGSLLAHCPINHWLNEQNDVDCAFRVRNMVQSILQTMEIIQKNSIGGNYDKVEGKLQDFYNEKAPGISKRTLLICEDGIGKKLSKTAITGIYPYKFEICDKAKIEQVIKDKSTEYYYLQAAITSRKLLFVIDPSNGETVYFGITEGFAVGFNIKEKNIEELVKMIKGKK